ncbi:MAG: hypothetical protein M3Z66_20545 [Chloroflexota bacterium]|nr:hypothetical protein [Chloroflexota bacterium]
MTADPFGFGQSSNCGSVHGAVGGCGCRPSPAAEVAIGLFLEYRDTHSYDEERAAALAVIEVREGVDATAEINAHEREGVS